MGKQDIVTKDYINSPGVFADAFNYFVYNGEQKIKPEKLQALDTSEVAVLLGKEVQVYRDSLRYASAMEDEETVYLILGIESQSEIHYAMPARNMLYDAMQYREQLRQISALHREEAKMGQAKDKAEQLEMLEEKRQEHKPNSGEFLYGFYKEDKLVPVITLVIYFGAEDWDGPISLHEMFDVTEEKVLQYVPDYKINLITPKGTTDEELDKLRSSLREVLLFIKYSEDKERLYEIIENDDRFKHVEQEAERVMNAVTGAKIDMGNQEGEEYVDMCKAIREMREEERMAGMKAGLEEGKRAGISEGRATGLEEGRRDGKLQMCLELVKKGLLTAAIAAQELCIPEEELLKQLQ